ncbi:MAG: Ig-like domain-containing protein, partial [Marinobacter sp.]|nr:Ig-like domain-containing protein [Marinobacter sp.]
PIYVTGSGTIANAGQQVSGINVSSLGDGTLTLSVALTDAVNNAADAVTDTATLDTNGPALQSSTPLNNASDVPYDTGLTLVFDESIQAGSGQLAIYDSADDSLHEAIAIGTVEVTDQTAAATLSEPLIPTHTYYVTIDSGALVDVMGNGFAGIANSTSLRFTVQNSTPEASNDAALVRQGETIAIEVLANDSDLEGQLNPASTRVTSGPSHGQVSVDTGTGVITYTPDAGFSGSDSFAYQVEDEFQEVSNVATVALDVTPVNQPPLAWSDVATVAPGQPVVIDLLTNDESGDSGDTLDASSIRLINRPLHGTASLNDSKLSYTPEEGFSGTERMRYTVLDQDGLESNIADVLINVTDTNQPPVATDDIAATAAGTPVTVDILANDSDTDGTLAPNTVRVLVHAHHGAVELDGTTGELTYTPDAGFRGEDQIAYTISDDLGLVSETAVVTFTVGASDAPVAWDDRVQLVGNHQHTLNVLGNDQGVNALVPGSLSVASGPAQGSVLIDAINGRLLYTPDEGFSGTDQLSYTVKDNQGQASNTATVTIGLEPVNHAPIANADWIELDEETSAVLPLITNDQDIEGSLAIANATLLTQPTSGQISVEDGGSLVYTPEEHFAGEDRFTYHIADATGTESRAAVVRLRISPVADVPLISGTPTTTVPAEAPYRFTPVAKDIDGNPLTFSISNKPAWASFDAATGRLSGTPDLEDVGLTESIVITVSNGEKSAKLPTFSLRVTDNSGGSQVVEDDSEPSGPTGPSGDENGGDLFQVDPDKPVLATPDTGWPGLSDGQSTAPTYSIAFIDQYGSPRRVQVTQGEGVATPVTSGPDGDGQQHLDFTQGDGSEQRVTITPQGETLASVYTHGGDPAPASRLTSDAPDLQTTVTDGGDVISRTTVELSTGGQVKVAITQSTASGVLLMVTPVSSEGVDAEPTRFQFDVVPATIRLARDGTVTAKAESTNGAGDDVALSVRIDTHGYLTASTTVDDGVNDPGTSVVVTALAGVMGELDTDANLLVAPNLTAPAEQVVTMDSEGVLRYDDEGTPVTGPLGTSIVLGPTGVSTITRNADPDLNGLRRAAEIGSSAGGTPTFSRLEVTDVDGGNAGVHVEPAEDGDGYRATRDLGDGVLQSLLRLDGSAVHQFSRPGQQTNEARTLVDNTLSILFEDRAVSVAERAGSMLYVEANTDGSVRHEVARAGRTTQAVSRASGSRTRLESVDDSTDVQVVTEAEIEGRHIRVIARSDGSAEHRLVNQTGQVTESSFDLAGTTTSISPLGNLKSRVRLGEGAVCAWVETFSNGETSTGFGRYDANSASCIDIQRPTNLDNAFEAGNQVEVKADGGSYSIIVETRLTRPIQF